jgi:hypothetical protein
MRISLSVFAALALSALPVAAQITTAPPTHVDPSTQGSRPGVAGLPGSKSGPAVRAPTNQSLSANQSNPTTSEQDPTGVHGQPGGKNGEPAKRP